MSVNARAFFFVFCAAICFGEILTVGGETQAETLSLTLVPRRLLRCYNLSRARNDRDQEIRARSRVRKQNCDRRAGGRQTRKQHGERFREGTVKSKKSRKNKAPPRNRAHRAQLFRARQRPFTPGRVGRQGRIRRAVIGADPTRRLLDAGRGDRAPVAALHGNFRLRLFGADRPYQ